MANKYNIYIRYIIYTIVQIEEAVVCRCFFIARVLVVILLIQIFPVYPCMHMCLLKHDILYFIATVNNMKQAVHAGMCVLCQILL